MGDFFLESESDMETKYQSYDENGDPVIPEVKIGVPKKQVDSKQFMELYHMYMTKDKKGKPILSKTRFAKQLGVSIYVLNNYLKDLYRDGRLDEQFKDDAVMAIRKHEAIDTPENILRRMGIM